MRPRYPGLRLHPCGVTSHVPENHYDQLEGSKSNAILSTAYGVAEQNNSALGICFKGWVNDVDGPLARVLRHALDESSGVGAETVVYFVEDVPRHDFNPRCAVGYGFRSVWDVISCDECDDIDLERQQSS